MGDTRMNEPEQVSKVLPTKAWLEEQVNSCQRAIERNIGAMNLCLTMIKAGVYCQEEKREELP